MTYLSDTSARSYYYLGSQRIAMRVSGDPDPGRNGLFYIHTDHLGSTSLLSDENGDLVEGSTTRFRPFGDYRVEPEAKLTDKGFTGHAHNDTIKLIDMKARWYSGQLGRFVQPDTIVPDPSNPQSLNRYAYVLNNPLRYVDPTGHYVALEDNDESLDDAWMGGVYPEGHEKSGQVINILPPAFRTLRHVLRDSPTGNELWGSLRGRRVMGTYDPFFHIKMVPTSWWIHLPTSYRDPDEMRKPYVACQTAHELTHLLQRSSADDIDAYRGWGGGTLQMEVEANIIRFAIQYELTGNSQHAGDLATLTDPDLDVAYEWVRRSYGVYRIPILYVEGASGRNPWAENLLALGFSEETIVRIREYAAVAPQ